MNTVIDYKNGQSLPVEMYEDFADTFENSLQSRDLTHLVGFELDENCENADIIEAEYESDVYFQMSDWHTAGYEVTNGDEMQLDEIAFDIVMRHIAKMEG